MIKAIIFDFDGTITKPFLNFSKIKSEIGFPPDEIYLLEKVLEMPEKERKRAFSILEKHEREAVEKSELNEGAHEILDILKEKNIKTALLTRNTHKSIRDACQKHGVCFDIVITREDAAAKPKPDGVILAGNKLNTPLSQIMLVGDYQFDIIAGKEAGVKTVLLTNGSDPKWDVKSDYTIHRLVDLAKIIG